MVVVAAAVEVVEVAAAVEVVEVVEVVVVVEDTIVEDTTMIVAITITKTTRDITRDMENTLSIVTTTIPAYRNANAKTLVKLPSTVI